MIPGEQREHPGPIQVPASYRPARERCRILLFVTNASNLHTEADSSRTSRAVINLEGWMTSPTSCSSIMLLSRFHVSSISLREQDMKSRLSDAVM